MPRKLEEWPGATDQIQFNSMADAYFKPYFDGNIWEFNDQEIRDFRVHLGLRHARTRDTLINGFKTSAENSAQRQGKSLRLKSVAGTGVILCATDLKSGYEYKGGEK